MTSRPQEIYTRNYEDVRDPEGRIWGVIEKEPIARLFVEGNERETYAYWTGKSVFEFFPERGTLRNPKLISDSEENIEEDERRIRDSGLKLKLKK